MQAAFAHASNAQDLMRCHQLLPCHCHCDECALALQKQAQQAGCCSYSLRCVITVRQSRQQRLAAAVCIEQCTANLFINTQAGHGALMGADGVTRHLPSLCFRFNSGEAGLAFRSLLQVR